MLEPCRARATLPRIRRVLDSEMPVQVNHTRTAASTARARHHRQRAAHQQGDDRTDGGEERYTALAVAPRYGAGPGPLPDRVGLLGRSGHPGEHHFLYTAGPCALARLERTLGPDAMAHLLESYAHDHWYGVSTTADFKKAALAVTDKDLTSFWKEHRIR